MMPNPLSQPLHGGFVASLHDGDPRTETAWLFALGDNYYEVPITQEIVEGRQVTVRNLDVARQFKELSYDVQTHALILDRHLCTFYEGKPEPKIADQLLMLALERFDRHSDDPIGVVWKGKKHVIPTSRNELSGPAGWSDFLREPEWGIDVVNGEQYVYRTDWSFPHRKGATSWYLLDFKDVRKIIDRPRINGRYTHNLGRMKLSAQVPADIAESLFLSSRDSCSIMGFISEVALPDRRVTLPRNIIWRGTVGSSADQAAPTGLLFSSLDIYYVPLEPQKGPDGQTSKIIARCDLMQKEDFEDARERTTNPSSKEELKLHFDVSPDESVAITWAVRKLFTVTQPYPADVLERNLAKPIRLSFRRIAQMHIVHEDKKVLVGVVYKVGNDKWYVPLDTTGERKVDMLDPSIPKAFRMGQINDARGSMKSDIYGIGNISIGVTKPSANTLETLRVAIKRHYRQELKAGKYVFG